MFLGEEALYFLDDLSELGVDWDEIMHYISDAVENYSLVRNRTHRVLF